MGKLEDAAASVGMKMQGEIENDIVIDALNGANIDLRDPLKVYKSGYLAGANDAYMLLTPRFTDLSRVIKTLYVMIGDISKRHDNIEVLTDMCMLNCEIASYLVAESEVILANNRSELSRKTAVPEEYLDNRITMSDIPPAKLREIGRIIAIKDSRRFALYAVSGGLSGKNGALTFEELAHMVQNEGFIPKDIATEDYSAILVKYGAKQVREARKLFTQLENSLEVFKKQHRNDATMIANRCIADAKVKR